MPVWALFVVPGTFSPWAAAPRPFVLEGMTIPTERKERSMSREKNVFEKFPKKWPKGPFGKPVRGERGNHDLPSGAKGGKNMDLEHHYRHKQHTFDAFRAVSL